MVQLEPMLGFGTFAFKVAHYWYARKNDHCLFGQGVIICIFMPFVEIIMMTY